MNRVKALWGALPHPVQALIVAFITAAGTSFLQSFNGSACFTAVCLKHSAVVSLGAGVAAARAFYMMPNRPAAAK